MVNVDKKARGLYQVFVKRLFDILISLLALIILAIPMLIIALCIKLDSRKDPIIFKQIRMGKDNVPFYIYKFRTMRTDAPHQMATEDFTHPGQYITKVGKVLRKTSLDELPQFLNVLKGDMSVIGPRPLISSEKKVLHWRTMFGADQVLPGITGLAQVRGRDELTGKKKAKYDGEYASNVSFSLDLRIFFKTIFNVVRAQGIHEGSGGLK